MNISQESLLTIICTFGGGVISTLTIAVGYLFKMIVENQKKIQDELHECQEDRERLWAEFGNLKCSIDKR